MVARAPARARDSCSSAVRARQAAEAARASRLFQSPIRVVLVASDNAFQQVIPLTFQNLFLWNFDAFCRSSSEIISYSVIYNTFLMNFLNY